MITAVSSRFSQYTLLENWKEYAYLTKRGNKASTKVEDLFHRRYNLQNEHFAIQTFENDPSASPERFPVAMAAGELLFTYANHPKGSSAILIIIRIIGSSQKS